MEDGSQWVLGWIEPEAENLTVISELALVEMFSLFARRIREGKLASSSAASLRADFLYHTTKEYLVVPVGAEVLSQARELVLNHPLRTLDAIQLASAFRAVELLQETMTFVSADNNLLARSEGRGISNR
jgi:predicted nucleic acid-binding protein